MPPLSMMIKPVSGACNMRCAYCFYADVASKRDVQSYGRMSEETLETLVRRAFAYADGGVSFAFQGGEPTLAGLPFYESLVRFQRKYNTRGLRVQNSLQTNGYALSDELIRFFAKEGFLLGVSIDGTRDTHDRMRRDARGLASYDAVRANVYRLREAGVAFNVLTVVNGYVAREPEATFEALREFGYLQYIPCLDGFDGEKQDYSLEPSAYASFLKRSFDCYERAFREGRFVSIRNFDNYVDIAAGHEPENCAMRGQCDAYYLFEADGSAYPCDFYVLDAWRMGNINADSFYRLAKSPVARAFREVSLYTSPECKSCPWARLCRGGCRRDREPFFEGKPALNRFCQAYQSFFQYSAARIEGIARKAKEANR